MRQCPFLGFLFGIEFPFSPLLPFYSLFCYQLVLSLVIIFISDIGRDRILPVDEDKKPIGL